MDLGSFISRLWLYAKLFFHVFLQYIQTSHLPQPAHALQTHISSNDKQILQFIFEHGYKKKANLEPRS